MKHFFQKFCSLTFAFTVMATGQTTPSLNTDQANAVVGAPFSGDAVSTKTPNGTPPQTVSGKFYRDAQGRTRVEQPDGSVDPWSAKTAKLDIKIIDPVAGLAYSLDPVNSVATSTRLRPMLPPSVTRKPSSLPEQETIDLGTQTIGGLACKGTQISRPIFKAVVGSSQALVITTQSWYSPVARLVVKYVLSDPTKGTFSFQLDNISLASPDPSLFVPPPGYTVTSLEH